MHPSDVPYLRARELLTVLALAEYGRFVPAAADLQPSHPPLTRTIKRVERVLGVTLFARNTRRVEITAAGREFVAVAERMLNDLKHTVRNLSEVTNEQRGRVTISTYSSFAIKPLVMFDEARLARAGSDNYRTRYALGGGLQLTIVVAKFEAGYMRSVNRVEGDRRGAFIARIVFHNLF